MYPYDTSKGEKKVIAVPVAFAKIKNINDQIS